MNKTVALVSEWGEFEKEYPNASIEDFCRNYLAAANKEPTKGIMVGGVIPPVSDGLLLKIMGRIHKLNMLYANMALKGTDLNQVEEFGMLLTIKLEKNPKKTEVIYSNLHELSSGTDMLNRLKSRNLIKEYDDKEDKRVKRIELTSKGEKVINTCMPIIMKIAKLMMNDLTEYDKQLCIQLLKNIEIKFSALWPKHKGKLFDEVYQSVIATNNRNKKSKTKK